MAPEYSVPHDDDGDSASYRLRRLEADTGHNQMAIVALADKVDRRLDRMETDIRQSFLPRTEFAPFAERFDRLEDRLDHFGWMLVGALGGVCLALVGIAVQLIIALQQGGR